jgi:Na+-transporting NADH:ubiquinone oxidoreductase subunit C
MKRFSDTYIFSFAVIMVVIVATVLSTVSINLRPLQEKNVEIRKKRSILAAMNIQSSIKNADHKFNQYITNSFVVNEEGKQISKKHAFDIKLKEELIKNKTQRRLPVFIGQPHKASKVYIFPLHGKGLWGAIYGYVALNSDLTTIYGITFGHDEETPGLGSQISKKPFQAQFKGKRVFDKQGTFHPVKVVKNNLASSSKHKVDAISGATITSKGVEEMIETCLGHYLNFIKQQKK